MKTAWAQALRLARHDRYCFPCYGVHFADKCKACKKPINPAPGFGGKVTIAKDHWHGGCYKCCDCGEGLAGKPCIPRDDGLWCKPCLKQHLRKTKSSRGSSSAADKQPKSKAKPSKPKSKREQAGAVSEGRPPAKLPVSRGHSGGRPALDDDSDDGVDV